ncbi:MAG: hypothetical protein K2Y22_10400 [Candidatus Obscuribacterales bacterium]|nr:hypothetical protein [Candidatus Obscuribacterales bacterium]
MQSQHTDWLMDRSQWQTLIDPDNKRDLEADLLKLKEWLRTKYSPSGVDCNDSESYVISHNETPMLLNVSNPEHPDALVKQIELAIGTYIWFVSELSNEQDPRKLKKSITSVLERFTGLEPHLDALMTQDAVEFICELAIAEKYEDTAAEVSNSITLEFDTSSREFTEILNRLRTDSLAIKKMLDLAAKEMSPSRRGRPADHARNKLFLDVMRMLPQHGIRVSGDPESVCVQVIGKCLEFLNIPDPPHTIASQVRRLDS